MKPWKISAMKTLDLYQSWKCKAAGIMLVILILIPLHHEIGYLELLIGDWYTSWEILSWYQYHSDTSFQDRPMYQDQAPISKEWYQTNTGMYQCRVFLELYEEPPIPVLNK
jgi:hypothetical protein